MSVLEIARIVYSVSIVIALIGIMVVGIWSIVTGEWNDEVRCPWEKEERKKAKAAEKAVRERKWYE